MIDGQILLGHSIPWGMVGGGLGSQIGYSHRSAALRDGSFRLVAGAFDIDAERGRQFGVKLGVDAARCYPDYRAMFDAGHAAPTASARCRSRRRTTRTSRSAARR